MAVGVRLLSDTPEKCVGLATTGIAGPEGGTVAKPVGLVWFGFAQRLPSGIIVHASSQIFEGDRTAVRHASVAFALRSACELLTP
jgi:nicotinamide-nucleotide amidase